MTAAAAAGSKTGNTAEDAHDHTAVVAAAGVADRSWDAGDAAVGSTVAGRSCDLAAASTVVSAPSAVRSGQAGERGR